MRPLKASCTVLIAAAIATPAWAHHPLDGMPMLTFGHGLLSGVGHPILGFDHLFFVLAMRAAAGLAGILWRGALAYLATMLSGCLLISLGGALPLQEILVVLSLVLIGLLIASQRPMPVLLLASVFAGFGLFHGAAFGGAIAEQESLAPWPVLAGYLLGLGLTQGAIAIGVGTLVTRLKPITARMGGAMVAGAGILLFP